METSQRWRLTSINEAVFSFTHMPKTNGFSCLQVRVDTFTGWIEVFPCHNEQAKEVIKILIHEIIPRFGLPRSLQSDNGSAFKAAVKLQEQNITYTVPGDPILWERQKKANDIIKRHLHKLTQETQECWF